MGDLRDAFFSTKPKAEIVEVDTGKGPRKYEVRGRTVGQQQDLMNKCRYKSGPKEGELNTDLFQIEALMATVYDPESGEQVFEDANRDHFKEVSAEPFNELLAAATRAAGLTDEVEVVKDLEGTPAAESSSE